MNDLPKGVEEYLQDWHMTREEQRLRWNAGKGKQMDMKCVKSNWMASLLSLWALTSNVWLVVHDRSDDCQRDCPLVCHLSRWPSLLPSHSTSSRCPHVSSSWQDHEEKVSLQFSLRLFRFSASNCSVLWYYSFVFLEDVVTKKEWEDDLRDG